MAERVLKIPKEFEQDFNTDKFRECFMRVLFDCKAWDYAGISGNYEYETLDMLAKAFNEAVFLPKGHGDLIDSGELLRKKIRFEDFDGDTFNIIHEETIINVQTIIEADKEEKNASVS